MQLSIEEHEFKAESKGKKERLGCWNKSYQ